jgi:glycosyltransferase involved in cell wall biosynthesis
VDGVPVLPYRRNSIGRSALAAALELGVPTVLAGTAETIAPLVPGEHVAAIPPRDPQALAATIGRLLFEPGQLERLAAGARRAAPFFSWPRIAATALDVYERV